MENEIGMVTPPHITQEIVMVIDNTSTTMEEDSIAMAEKEIDIT